MNESPKASAVQAELDGLPVQEFDGYRLMHLLGKGRMGQVYLAEDTLLERLVAVKFISELSPDSHARDRFFVEARAIARVQHPNVAAIYRVGEVRGHPYLIGEFVRGEGLDRLAKPVPWRRALDIGRGLARGLAAAHRHGVVHRDIKPANAILSEDGEAKLLDFGLAKLVPRLPGTRSGQASTRPVPAPLAVSPARKVEATLPVGALLESTVELPGGRVEPGRLGLVPSGWPENTATGRGPGPHAGAGALPPGAGRAELSMTAPGAAMGTPLYMAPEVWRGEAATTRSDIYSLGALLFHLCAGRPPHDRDTLEELRQAVLALDCAPLAEAAPAVDARLAAVIDRCLKHEPALRFASGEELREALEQLEPDRHAAAIPQGNPFRGLSAFEAEHRALFFGRAPAVRAILDRLRTDPFVLVAGDSGVGKSSVCRAGVLPLVAEGELDARRRWSTVSFSPGRRPLLALAEALSRELGQSVETLLERLRGELSSLGRELRGLQRDRAGLVLFVDQLEELITVSDPAEAAQVSEILGFLIASTPELKLMATLRGDFLTRIAALPRLGDEVTRALYLLRPLSGEGIREAIVGPARATGVSFESDQMVDALVDSTARAEGALPLLQFALAELWEARDRSRQIIPQAALEAMGGVAGALSRHADGILSALGPAQRESARRLLVALVTPERTRARQTEAELGAEEPWTRAALDALVRGRLLVVRGAGEAAGVEVAHEALLHDWPTLRRWLEQSDETRLVRDRLAAAAREWERQGRPRDALWSRRQLSEAQGVAMADLAAREAQFVRASQAQARRDLRTRIVALVAIPLVLGAVASTVWLRARRGLQDRVAAKLAEGERALDEARRISTDAQAARGRAFALFDASSTDAAERTWTTALGLGARAERTYAQASQALEAALSIDPRQTRIRALFADALFDRALLADRDQRTVQRDELVQRLTLYDDDGSRRRDLAAPAAAVFDIDAPGARLQLERYHEDESGSLELQRVFEAPGIRRGEEHRLQAGSYLLTVTAPGRASVATPFVLERGERLGVSVQLPAAADVPAGFSVVPPGRFLYGTAADESLRRGFFQTAPVHPVVTGGYLIRQHETTYQEWIAFLEALPREERKRRLPHAGQIFTGGLSVEEPAAGRPWKFIFHLGQQHHEAFAGAPVDYAHRASRAAQDWRQFPVAGISADDADAYLAWLDTTGRVPGARLCDEREWERAARGADGRDFPHGSRLDPDDANFDETYGRDPLGFGPDVVGAHPRSRSPFGVDDLAGNVWEWTRSATSPTERVLRGGSFYHDRNSARAYNRQVSEPSLHDQTAGLRVCAPLHLR